MDIIVCKILNVNIYKFIYVVCVCAYMCLYRCVCVCVSVVMCVGLNKPVEIADIQSFEGLLLQICIEDDVYFLSSTNMHAVSTCNFQNVSVMNTTRTY